MRFSLKLKLLIRRLHVIKSFSLMGIEKGRINLRVSNFGFFVKNERSRLISVLGRFYLGKRMGGNIRPGSALRSRMSVFSGDQEEKENSDRGSGRQQEETLIRQGRRMERTRSARRDIHRNFDVPTVTWQRFVGVETELYIDCQKGTRKCDRRGNRMVVEEHRRGGLVSRNETKAV